MFFSFAARSIRRATRPSRGSLRGTGLICARSFVNQETRGRHEARSSRLPACVREFSVELLWIRLQPGRDTPSAVSGILDGVIAVQKTSECQGTRPTFLNDHNRVLFTPRPPYRETSPIGQARIPLTPSHKHCERTSKLVRTAMREAQTRF